MHISKLELFGFKSFAKKETVIFDSGITGIVGPNGCGKSNLVEAIKWVMGETSAKQMRGSEMDDIIFYLFLIHHYLLDDQAKLLKYHYPLLRICPKIITGLSSQETYSQSSITFRLCAANCQYALSVLGKNLSLVNWYYVLDI